MGEKAVVLVGRAVDARTRAPVKAKLVFWDEDGNDHSVFVEWQGFCSRIIFSRVSHVREGTINLWN